MDAAMLRQGTWFASGLVASEAQVFLRTSASPRAYTLQMFPKMAGDDTRSLNYGIRVAGKLTWKPEGSLSKKV